MSPEDSFARARKSCKSCKSCKSSCIIMYHHVISYIYMIYYHLSSFSWYLLNSAECWGEVCAGFRAPAPIFADLAAEFPL